MAGSPQLGKAAEPVVNTLVLLCPHALWVRRTHLVGNLVNRGNGTAPLERVGASSLDGSSSGHARQAAVCNHYVNVISSKD